jgi:hypothetical protein
LRDIYINQDRIFLMYDKLINFPVLVFFMVSLGLFACTDGTEGGDGLNPEKGEYSSFIGEPEGDGPDYNPNNGMNNINNTTNPFVVNKETIEDDIIKVEENTLYSLSTYGGFVVMNIGSQDQINILGQFPIYEKPVKMYIEDGMAYIMFSSSAIYNWDETSLTGTFDPTSKFIVLDIHDPTNITQVASHELPGEITHFQKVGEMIYTISYEIGFCHEDGSCVPSLTTVTSLEIGDLANIYTVDQISFESDLYYTISIHMNQERIYVSPSELSNGHSTVQIVDISDPSGVMSLGDEIEITGTIENNWQMDEFNGVFRVVSSSDYFPMVETFTVTEPNTLVPLGSMDMVLPHLEGLRFARFDGTRAYGRTSEHSNTSESLNPIFTIDLSDPANPVQGSELEIPGILQHMEPRGDRLIALGFDADDGSQITMSIIDVSNLDNPVILDSANLGAEWSYLVEEQTEAYVTSPPPHVVGLNVLDDQGIILMPFAGWDESGYQSGVQIFSFTQDSIIKRGIVPHHGFTRRSIMHNDRLYSMSDEKVESFNINDFDNPVHTDSSIMARSVSNCTPLGDGYIAQLSMNWWSLEAKLDITTAEDPNSLNPLGTISLNSLAGSHPSYYFWRYGFNHYHTRIFAKDHYIYLIRGEESWPYGSEEDFIWSEFSPTQLLVFDVINPSQPQLVSTTDFLYPFPRNKDTMPPHTNIHAGDTVVMAGDTIVVRPDGRDWWYWDQTPPVDPALYGIDVSDPTTPVISFEIPRVEDEVYDVLQVKGDLIVTSHYEPIDQNPDTVMYYMDRVDLSNPAAPDFLPPVNIPGSLIDYNPITEKLITVGYTLNSVQTEDPNACWELGYYDSRYDSQTDKCSWAVRSLHILDLNGNVALISDTKTFTQGSIALAKATDSRLFVQLNQSYYWTSEESGGQVDPRPLLNIYAVDDSFTYPLIGSIRLPSPNYQLHMVQGDHAVVVQFYPFGVRIIDATDRDNIHTYDQENLSNNSCEIPID